MSAVTAPGVCNSLKWDEARCAHLGAHRHSGELGCKFEEWPAHQWNRTAPARWRAMHGEAYRRCKREGLTPWLLTRVWELQKRGLLHVHPVLAYSTASERRAADRYLEHLDDLRHRWGFGYVERKRLVREPSAAAAYLSSYFVTGKRRKMSLQESVQSPEMPRSIIHVSTKLTQISGVTMRSLRLHRYRWVLIRQIDEFYEYVGDYPDVLLDRLYELDESLTRGP
jgi:hypothetical protein